MTENESAFPWLEHLPTDDQREFFEELRNAFGEVHLRTMPGVQVSPKTYMDVLNPLLAAWKSTAEVHADPEVREALTADHKGPEMARGEHLCGASLPHMRDEDGWRWCIGDFAHSGKHFDASGTSWDDGEAVEVHFVEHVWAVPGHKHNFVFDEDACVARIACELTWNEFLDQTNTWKGASADHIVVDEISDLGKTPKVPNQRREVDGE